MNRSELIDDNGNLTAAALAMIETNARAFTDAVLVNSIARTQSAEARDLYQAELDRRWIERLDWPANRERCGPGCSHLTQAEHTAERAARLSL